MAGFMVSKPKTKLLAKTCFGSIILVQMKDGKFVVVKVSTYNSEMKKFQSENPINECKILWALGIKKHSNIIELKSMRIVDGKLKIILPYFPEGDLFDWVKQMYDSYLKKECAINTIHEKIKMLFFQLVKAIDHIHKHGICHLDISLENVLLDDNCKKAVLCDFGAARFMEKKSFLAIPHGHKIPGKKGYVAPEIWYHKDFNGVKADVWSLGVVLCILLTGNMPYFIPCIKNDKNMRYLWENGKLPPVLCAFIPSNLQSLVHSMMCINPKDRITTKEILDHPWFK